MTNGTAGRSTSVGIYREGQIKMIKLKERRVLFGTPEETDAEIQKLLDDIDKKDKEEAEEERLRRIQELEDEKIINRKSKRRKRVREAPNRKPYI